MSRPRSVANAEGETEVPLSHISQFNLSPSEGSRSNGLITPLYAWNVTLIVPTTEEMVQ